MVDAAGEQPETKTVVSEAMKAPATVLLVRCSNPHILEMLSKPEFAAFGPTDFAVEDSDAFWDWSHSTFLARPRVERLRQQGLLRRPGAGRW